MEQLDMFGRKNDVYLYRYLRKEYNNSVGAKGGICFYFHIDQKNSKLYVSYSVCHSDDNFDRKLGMKISKGRYQTYIGLDLEKVLEMDYDRSLSLIDNVWFHIVSMKHDVEKNGYMVKDFWCKELLTLYLTMKEIKNEQ